MAQQGWVRLYRSLLDWRWWHDSKTTHLFIYCLLNANYEITDYKGMKIEKGEFVTTLEKLSKELGLSVQNVRTSLKRLKSTQELTSKVTNKNTIIKVVNWAFYQSGFDSSNKQSNTIPNKQLTNKQQTTNKQADLDPFLDPKEPYIYNSDIININTNNTNTNNTIDNTIIKEIKNKEEKKEISINRYSQRKVAQPQKTGKIDFQEIVEYWNNNSRLSKIQFLSDLRKTHIRMRIEDTSLENFYEMIDLVSESDFLRGDNNKNWKATFDWCINKSNYIKILEGNYKNKESDLERRVRQLNERLGEVGYDES